MQSGYNNKYQVLTQQEMLCPNTHIDPVNKGRSISTTRCVIIGKLFDEGIFDVCKNDCINFSNQQTKNIIKPL
jgi:hypothetical protein